MAALSDEQWRRVASAYNDTNETVASIARRFGISPAAINKRRVRQGWASRRAGAERGQSPGGQAPGGQSPGSGNTIGRAVDVAPAFAQRSMTEAPDNETPAAGMADKSALLGRFYRLINLKLEQMEDDMARSDERTPADNEREARALGTLIRNFEKVLGLEQDGGNDGKQAGNGPEPQAEAEAIRRELAERLVRLRKANRGDG